MSKETSETLKILLGGFIVGAAIGILFAPEKGKKTRKKLRKKFEAGQTFLFEESEHLAETLKNNAESVKEKLEKSFNDFIDDGKEKTEEIITLLEDKLHRLKESLEQKS